MAFGVTGTGLVEGILFLRFPQSAFGRQVDLGVSGIIILRQIQRGKTDSRRRWSWNNVFTMVIWMEMPWGSLRIGEQPKNVYQNGIGMDLKHAIGHMMTYLDGWTCKLMALNPVFPFFGNTWLVIKWLRYGQHHLFTSQPPPWALGILHSHSMQSRYGKIQGLHGATYIPMNWVWKWRMAIVKFSDTPNCAYV